nr:MAG TPA: hypothetical protein [Caudoviricetes sp.]
MRRLQFSSNSLHWRVSLQLPDLWTRSIFLKKFKKTSLKLLTSCNFSCIIDT